jgi:hypothetical protein
MPLIPHTHRSPPDVVGELQVIVTQPKTAPCPPAPIVLQVPVRAAREYSTSLLTEVAARTLHTLTQDVALTLEPHVTSTRYTWIPAAGGRFTSEAMLYNPR